MSCPTDPDAAVTTVANRMDVDVDGSCDPKPEQKPNPNKFYANVHVCVKEDVMCHAIGKRGRHFNRIKRAAGIDQLVYNKQRRMIHLYGAQDALDVAADMMRAHLNKVADDFGRCELSPEAPDQKDFLSVADIAQGHMRHIIGKKGRHFKRLTRNSGTSYVWYDTENNSIVIYGSEKGIANAKKDLERLKTYACTKIIPKYESATT